jgi:hypothetical protein
MKETTQHDLGRLLVLLGEQMQSNFDTPAKVEALYVTDEVVCSLKVEFLVAAAGPGGSDTIGCSELVRIIAGAGCWPGRTSND